MIKGVVFRIYPNKIQKELINRTIGCCRFVYNYGLAMRETSFSKGEKTNFAKTCRELTLLKRNKSYEFLNEVDSIALQQSLRDLDKAYQGYWKKQTNKPRFKKKHDLKQSYRTINQRDHIFFSGNYLKLPKLGYVKVKQSMDIGTIHNVTVKKSPTNKYYVVLTVEFEPLSKQNNNNQIGIDVGLKEFYTDSNNKKVNNPKYFEKSLKKLKREHRSLSRKQLTSNNRNKQCIKVARVYEKIANQRNDFLQKESTKLIRENQTICIEDLSIDAMKRNHKLSKAISSVSWSRFFEMLEYKAKWYGNTVIRIPTFYPSSQVCCCCGYKNPLIKNLYIRKWKCPICNAEHDRDHNASINILKQGLALA